MVGSSLSGSLGRLDQNIEGKVIVFLAKMKKLAISFLRFTYVMPSDKQYVGDCQDKREQGLSH